MAQETFDIPATELPFELGNGGFATMSVSEGIAHIVVKVKEAHRAKTKGAISSWIDENEDSFAGVEVHGDPILEAMASKYAPELLDRR